MSDGIKVGGYPTWTQEPFWPTCPNCDQHMDHLLTINSSEFDGESRQTWLTIEDTPTTGTIWDPPYEERTQVQCPPGLMLGDMGGIYLFEYLRCPDRPFAYHPDAPDDRLTHGQIPGWRPPDTRRSLPGRYWKLVSLRSTTRVNRLRPTAARLPISHSTSAQMPSTGRRSGAYIDSRNAVSQSALALEDLPRGREHR
ncbi:hypothetical protein [Streptomyces sp. NBC_00859]|uniref:hypothetical protein n=1 Tax=Streptomyces sp. NBC_00859 TaxID=2903682 RepID=UPI00386868C6|nr:hypothetical protein OG584_00535 [Streptomyces sp. NBC_00859]